MRKGIKNEQKDKIRVAPIEYRMWNGEGKRERENASSTGIFREFSIVIRGLLLVHHLNDSKQPSRHDMCVIAPTTCQRRIAFMSMYKRLQLAHVRRYACSFLINEQFNNRISNILIFYRCSIMQSLISLIIRIIPKSKNRICDFRA